MDLNQDTKSKMEKIVGSLKNELGKLRTGRASPTLVEHIKVDYYGTPTPLNQVGQISVPDPRTIQIASWDQSAIPLIEKAIIVANIGLTPIVDGKLVRLSIPPLTEERRKEIAKTVKKIGEESKVAVRNIRRDSNEAIKTQEKSKTLTEDQSKKLQEQIQKVTDTFVGEIDKIIEAKTKDIMTI
jgi:ribosome recycling factor